MEDDERLYPLLALTDSSGRGLSESKRIFFIGRLGDILDLLFRTKRKTGERAVPIVRTCRG